MKLEDPSRREVRIDLENREGEVRELPPDAHQAGQLLTDAFRRRGPYPRREEDAVRGSPRKESRRGVEVRVLSHVEPVHGPEPRVAGEVRRDVGILVHEEPGADRAREAGQLPVEGRVDVRVLSRADHRHRAVADEDGRQRFAVLAREGAQAEQHQVGHVPIQGAQGTRVVRIKEEDILPEHRQRGVDDRAEVLEAGERPLVRVVSHAAPGLGADVAVALARYPLLGEHFLHRFRLGEAFRRPRREGGEAAGVQGQRKHGGLLVRGIPDGAPVEDRHEPVPERLDGGPRERLGEAQADAAELPRYATVDLAHGFNAVDDVAVKALPDVEAEPVVEQPGREAHAEAEPAESLHRVEQRHAGHPTRPRPREGRPRWPVAPRHAATPHLHRRARPARMAAQRGDA